MLDAAVFDIRKVSSVHVCAFAHASSALTKMDPIDARLIAQFIAFQPHSGCRFPTENLCHLNALSAKKCQLVELQKRPKCQIQQHHDPKMVALDNELLNLLSHQIKVLEDAVQTQIIADPERQHHAKILRSIPGVGPFLWTTLIAVAQNLMLIANALVSKSQLWCAN